MSTPTEMHIDALMDKIEKLEAKNAELHSDSLEDHYEYKRVTTQLIKDLRDENARYREALEFYAEAWERGDYNGDLLVRKIGSYDAFEEVHERAREALKGK